MEDKASGRDQVPEALKEECASLSVQELAEFAGLPKRRVPLERPNFPCTQIAMELI
jgi:hypothetical protein